MPKVVLKPNSAACNPVEGLHFYRNKNRRYLLIKGLQRGKRSLDKKMMADHHLHVFHLTFCSSQIRASHLIKREENHQQKNSKNVSSIDHVKNILCWIFCSVFLRRQNRKKKLSPQPPSSSSSSQPMLI